MNKKEHIKFLKIASWDDFTEMLLELEQQRFTLKELMTKKELEALEEVIEMYDQHRAQVLDKMSKEGGFVRSLGLEEQGMDEIQPDIGGLDDGY